MSHNPHVWASGEVITAPLLNSIENDLALAAVASDVSVLLAGKANTASLATVATTGSYTDLSNKPTIPALTGPNTWTGTQDFTGATVTGVTPPEYTIASGLWWTPSSSATGTGALATLNVMVLAPLKMPAATGLAALAVEVSTAASAGGVVRAGFYGSTGNGTPDMTTLIADLGTQSSTTTGIKTFTPGAAVTLPKGMIWFALVAQTATCTVRVSSGANETAMPYPSGVAPSAGSNIQVLNVGGVSAGLPTSGSPGAGTILIAPPKVWLQAS